MFVGNGVFRGRGFSVPRVRPAWPDPGIVNLSGELLDLSKTTIADTVTITLPDTGGDFWPCSLRRWARAGGGIGGRLCVLGSALFFPITASCQSYRAILGHRPEDWLCDFCNNGDCGCATSGIHRSGVAETEESGNCYFSL